MALLALAATLAAACGPTEPAATPAVGTAPAAVQPAPAPPAPPEPPAASAAPALGNPARAGQVDAALAQLAALPIKGRAPKTGYSRDQFGPAWTDAVAVEGGSNGCDTRNDILRRDLTALTFKPGSGGCTVLTGMLADPYTGTNIEFQRGAGTSMEVQIDHVVALSDAWQKGAQQLDAPTRQDLANDPRNLQAAQGKANQQKSDGDAATWLPANKPYRCTYVARQVEVKAAYGLWVTSAEHDAIERVLRDCAAHGTMPGPNETEPVRAPEPEPTPAPALPQPPPADLAPASGDVVFANCAAARAAGAAPLYAGQPGYRPQMDGDKDGIACE